MKRFSKFISFFLLLSLLFSFAGCGEGAPALTTQAPTEPTAEATTQSPTEATTEAPTEAPTQAPTQAAQSSLTVHFIDVGQADAALVSCDGHYMLIDGGNREDSNLIFSVLKRAGVPKLDMVVATHAHEDHIGGLPGAYNCCGAEMTLCPVLSYDSGVFEDFARYAEEKGGGITVPKVGDTYPLGAATVTILGVNSESDTNNTSIVLRIDHGAVSFLFTGDAEYEAEQVILASGADLPATVLKVGHHGSDSSTSYSFLRQILPQYAVISVGQDNSYGHPTQEVLSRLRDADVTVFRTDLQGDIFCTSDGVKVTFQVSANPDADVFSGLGGNSTQEQTQTTTQENIGTHYVLNTNSKKFHYPDCSSADTISQQNRQDYYGTREELLEQGYSPCGNCDP